MTKRRRVGDFKEKAFKKLRPKISLNCWRYVDPKKEKLKTLLFSRSRPAERRLETIEKSALRSGKNAKNAVTKNVHPQKKKFNPPRLLVTDETNDEDVKTWLSLYGKRSFTSGKLKKPVAKYRYDLDHSLVLYTPPITDETRVHVVVDPKISKVLRLHQRAGVEFMYACLTGEKHSGLGAILADDMGLGKTLQSITILWTLLVQSPRTGPTAAKAVIICPATLVKNWEMEIHKWLGDRAVDSYPAIGSRQKVITKIDNFLRAPQRNHAVLILSYETFRIHCENITACSQIDLVIADEGHRLKNVKSGISIAVSKFRTKRRLLLSGTPIQNNLDEFYAIVQWCNPGMLGTQEEFSQNYKRAIDKARWNPDECTDAEIELAKTKTTMLVDLVRSFLIRRTSKSLEQHLPAKTEFIVFCALTTFQRRLYRKFIASKIVREANVNMKKSGLISITSLTKLCNHPRLIYDDCKLVHDSGFDEESMLKKKKKRRGCKIKKRGRSKGPRPKPELSGLFDLYPRNYLKLIKADDSGKTHLVNKICLEANLVGDKVVLVSNYTQTLMVLTLVFQRSGVTYVLLDGSIPTSRRQKIVDKFNLTSQFTVMLLSSKAGGCGLNLIGANRLVMFDPDWNPANDLQAMARIWRSGQKKPCYIYRLFSTGTIEEKMFQRQIFKNEMADSLMTGCGEEESVRGDMNEDMEDEEDEFADLLEDENDLRVLFNYNEHTLCETQSKIIGNQKFADWKRNKGVVGVDDDVLYTAGKEVVTFLFSKYVNKKREIIHRKTDKEIMKYSIFNLTSSK